MKVALIMQNAMQMKIQLLWICKSDWYGYGDRGHCGGGDYDDDTYFVVIW